MERVPEARSLESVGEGNSRVLSEPLALLRAAQRPGFLFSGGSARCIFQVGVVEQLYALGITPYATLGVSGGAWNAAAVAAGNWQKLRAYRSEEHTSELQSRLHLV